MSGKAADILVVGMPRSGTTWLGKIFDSHPDTIYRHEPDSHSRIDGVPLLPDPKAMEDYADRLRHYHSTIIRNRSAKVCAKTPIFRKNYMSEARRLFMCASMVMTRVADKGGLSVSVAGAPKIAPNGARLVWKSIESIGRLPLFHYALPMALSVHLIRHPCGYIASVLRGESAKKFEDQSSASEDFGIFEILVCTRLAKKHLLTVDYLKTLHPEERLAWRWVLFNDIALETSACSPRCITVRYEDICDDPIATSRKLFEFADLEWSQQTEAFLMNSTAQSDKGYYSVFKNPAESANKWRQELDVDKIRRILAITAPTAVGKLFADD